MQPEHENNSSLIMPGTDLLRNFRGILEDGGYLSSDFVELAARLSARKPAPAEQAGTAESSSQTVLEELFFLGSRVGAGDAARVLGIPLLRELDRCGLLAGNDRLVWSTVQLLPYRGLALACDFRERNFSKNHVIGITPASDSLVRLTIRRHSASTLDLGAGSGVQALLAARHSDSVVAVDINSRAVNLAEFSSRLNGFSQVVNLAGDMFQPVAGRTFDLIVTCPPFVISPDNNFFYLDSGKAGDAMVEQIVRDAPAFMNEGGFCQIICEIVQYRGQEWQARMLDWLQGSGCDAWMLHRVTMSPEDYARVWVTDRTDSPGALMKKWLKFYRRARIESITSGLLTMRKRSNSANWYRVDQMPPGVGDCGGSVEYGFRIKDYLDARRHRALFLADRLRIAENVQVLRQENDGAMMLRTTQGFSFSESVNRIIASFLNACDGSRTVEESLRVTRTTLGQDISMDSMISVLERLLIKGLVVPV